jgi:hypothetical protein
LQGSADNEEAAQYIVTTFHPQIVEISDKSYGVAHSNRVSTIRALSREQAVKFVKGDRSHRQGAGGSPSKPAAAVPGERASKRQKENSHPETNAAGAAEIEAQGA